MMNMNRRGFLRGMAGVSLLGAGGCFSIGGKRGQIRLAAVGVLGKGYSDWTPMLRTGLVKMVAFCDADYSARKRTQEALKRDGIDFDVYSVPFYTDYRQLLDDAGKLGIDAMTISTPDHVHAPAAIGAMKQGIHVYVQKPLVRTLWELKYFEKTAREYGVVTQMGNQGSSLDSMRRCTEVIQSGILGEVKEVHVWTNRPVWPQGKVLSDYIASRGSKGDAIPGDLNWDAYVATQKSRPYLGKFPEKLGPFHNDWKIAPNVYHAFNWRGSVDFGAGAFGDMACHTMNLPFRGLELGGVSQAELVQVEGASELIYPCNSIVKLTYKKRVSKVQKNADGSAKELPEVSLLWYDGDLKPKADIMPKWAATHDGKVPNTGCYIIGTAGAVLMQDDYGGSCALALNDDKAFVDIFQHEAAKAVARRIPFCAAASAAAAGESTVEMKGFAEGHYVEFLNAIRGEGNWYEQTHSRCFSDIEYSIPQMEGILVGCIAQRVNRPGVKLAWNSAKQEFAGSKEANALVKPYIRDGWAF